MLRQVYLLYVLTVMYTVLVNGDDKGNAPPSSTNNLGSTKAPTSTQPPVVTEPLKVTQPPVVTEPLKVTQPPVVTESPSSVSITYTCKKNNVTEMSIGTGNYTQVKVMTENGKYCKPSIPNKQGVIECINKMFITKKNVTMVYGDEKNPVVVGGQNINYFLLSCNEKSVTQTVHISLNLLQTTKKPTIIDATIITDKPDFKIKNGLTTVKVGQSVTLAMSIAAPHALQPDSCTAYKNSDRKEPYIFWENCKTLDTAIIPSKQWKKSNDPSVNLEIEMFAFKFIDSTNLIIECSVTVCPTLNAEECKKECPPNRRRRSSTDILLKKDSKVETKTATIALQVLDNHVIQQNGSGGIPSQWYSIAIGIALTWWTTSKRLL